MVVAGRWRIADKPPIGSGTFSTIYEAQNHRGQVAAVKLDKSQNSNSHEKSKNKADGPLKREAQCLMDLAAKNCHCSPKLFAKDPARCILVMQKLGDSLVSGFAIIFRIV